LGNGGLGTPSHYALAFAESTRQAKVGYSYPILVTSGLPVTRPKTGFGFREALTFALAGGFPSARNGFYLAGNRILGA